MNYVIEKHITKKYEVMDIARFLKYATFVGGRKGMRNTPKTCFRCGHKFTDDEYTYLGVVKGDKNRIFCKSCAEHIASIIGKEKLSKLC
jgi:hypothetical protein